MKKKIEGELISIAHRLLKLKNHTETVQLLEEVKKLYEQLTLLKFYESNTALVNEEFSDSVFEEKVAKIVVGTIEVEDEDEEVMMELASKEHIAQIEEELFEKNEISHEAFPGNGEEVVEMASVEHINKIKEELFEKNTISHEAFPDKADKVVANTDDVEVEPVLNDVIKEIIQEKNLTTNPEIIGTKVSKQISMDDIFVHDYKDTTFVKKEDLKEEMSKVESSNEKIEETILTEVKAEHKQEIVVEAKPEIKQQTKTETSSIGKAISLGLNDKIAFEKNLFDGNADDLQRVISQLNSLSNWDEAKSFVVEFVKPDYNNWQGKEEFEVRFLEIVENKFK